MRVPYWNVLIPSVRFTAMWEHMAMNPNGEVEVSEREMEVLGQLEEDHSKLSRRIMERATKTSPGAWILDGRIRPKEEKLRKKPKGSWAKSLTKKEESCNDQEKK